MAHYKCSTVTVTVSRPYTRKQLQSMLGLFNYYRSYIDNYALLMLPLTKLTRGKKVHPLPWSEEHQQAFDRFKRILLKPPVLRLANFSKDFHLFTDASNKAIAGVLMQEHNGIKFPIQFCSRALTDAETRYIIIELECLAIVFACEKFYPFLYGKSFHLYIDNRPLTYLNRAKLKSPRIMRWALALQVFSFQVHSISTDDNTWADWLSRMY